MALKARQKVILQALSELGGEATTRQIATKLDLNVNGVSQSLGAMSDEHVRSIGGRRGDTKWKLVMKSIAHISPILHRGVVYTKVGMFIITTEKMYQPEDATGTNIDMWMQGPSDIREVDPGEYPFTALYDQLKEATEQIREKILAER